MFDIQHDSPVPIHEQLTSQIRSHIASGALKAGTRLAEYREFAQELLTNPQVVARAYGDLHAECVLKKCPDGTMEITEKAASICRAQLQASARQRIGRAVAQGLAAGLAEAEIIKAVQEELSAARIEPLSPEQAQFAIKKSTHETSHRDSQGIQDLSRKNRPGFP
jgi:GntR family transcriptional regulator